ncbi:MAG TPA: DUF4241 domain-containing protein [Longimicrobium sp.]|nr:DUF4241 domain-containing protein [Longimicrobium sp.]
MTDLSDALVEGTRVAPDGESLSLALHALGNLVLPTGRIVACDPFMADEDAPFTRSVPPGRYPVLVNVARRTNGDQRVAYAILRFADPRPVGWEMALLPGQDTSTLGENEFFGYGVDAGTGCFMDASVVKPLVERSTPENGYSEDLVELMEKTYVSTWSWMDYVLDPGTGANVIAFSSGWGDGAYPSWWGLDESGAAVCLVTDFGLFWPDPED